MGINSLHFPDDRAAGAQTVSTVDIGQPKLAIGDAVVSEIKFCAVDHCLASRSHSVAASAKRVALDVRLITEDVPECDCWFLPGTSKQLLRVV